MLIAFHKPYQVLSCFTPDGSPNRTLAEFGFPKNVYAIGRLDADSEGLLLLSDEAAWNAKLLTPGRAHPRTYSVQVEGVPGEAALEELRSGIVIQGQRTLPCQAWKLEEDPGFPPRHPPIRVRKTVPDTWIALVLTEGRNRQVRRMTAAVGHPTLRLVRQAIGGLSLRDLELSAGQWMELDGAARQAVLRR
jgi:23S rRNA pseudouridine2457 synthase